LHKKDNSLESANVLMDQSIKLSEDPEKTNYFFK